MSDLFREAEEELRKETAENLAKRVAPFVIGAIVLGLAGSAGWQFWQSEQAKAIDKAGVAYDAAMAKLQAGDLTGGAASLGEIAKTGPDGFAAQAMLQRAAVLQEQSKSAEARVAYEEAAKKIKDADLADLARLMPVCAGVRRWGAASLDLAYVAAGRYDGYWERELQPWDIAAGLLLVKEAGGMVGPVRDGDDILGRGAILCANEPLFEGFTKIIRNM